MKIAIAIAAALVLLVMVMGFAQFIGPRMAKYRTTDRAIEFVLFGMRAWSIPFTEISDVRSVSFFRLLFFGAVNLLNRPFGTYVLIRRRRGIFRSIAVSPDQPERFIVAVKKAIETTGTQHFPPQ